MIESLKIRWFIVVATLLLAIFTLIPNFAEVGEDWWGSKDKIVYGLDIQGGLHLVLGVDVEGVIAEKAKRLVDNLPAEFKDQNVKHGEIVLNPENKKELTISYSSPEEEEAISKFISDYYGLTLQVVESEENKVIVRFYDSKIQEYKKQVIDQAIEVIRNRIDEYGVSEPSIAAQGDNRIIVQLPGIDDAARAKNLINKTARLTFHPVSTEVDASELQKWVDDAEAAGKYTLGKENANDNTVESKEQGDITKLAYTAYLKRLREDLKDKLPKDTTIVFEKAGAAINLEAGKIPYLVKTNNNLTGDLLEDANVRPDEFGRPEVIFRFGVEGRRQFAQMSGDNVGKQVAIILDGVIKSAPNIQEKIDSATARITLGNRGNVQETQKEAQDIATVLRAGALPAALEQLEERTVGPTLGHDSIEKGKMAGLIGAVLVLIFMAFYYRQLGIIADLALIFNIFLILAILTSLGATLTLPGVAGIVLTVGMAVDANVIIFERIKEELRKGTGLQMAIKDGFGNAFSAIFDANITTAAVCVVLMYFGTGPVRGFAVTLICGIVTSMFTAIFVSRAIIDLLIQKFQVKNLMKV
ncbi:MAG: protein translocase subunit SecD [Bdellovibrionales bacterium]|nr:protein translocase subunit SecD [Bdellovibrionales bacterium]